MLSHLEKEMRKRFALLFLLFRDEENISSFAYHLDYSDNSNKRHASIAVKLTPISASHHKLQIFTRDDTHGEDADADAEEELR